MIICCLITLNNLLTYWKNQLCTLNQSWNMDILKFNKYCILCSIALLHVKMKFSKTTLKLLYIIDYLLFKKMLTCWKIQLCTHNQSWDMDILKCNKYCILCSIALMHVKIKIWKTTLKLLYMIDYLLFNNTKWDVNLLKISIMYK